MNKTAFGLNENLAAALAYLGFFVTGIVFLVSERENKFVRFAALQSTITFIPLALAMWVIGLFTGIPLLGAIFGLARWIIGAVMIVSWLYLVFTAYKGQAVKMWLVGDICWEQVHK